MPRKYVLKKPDRGYTKEDIARAVHDIQNKNLTYQQAEDFYHVPKSVIYHRIKGRKVNLNHVGSGRSTALKPEVEQELRNCIVARARMGYPCNKNDIKTVVEEYVTENNMATPFVNKRPGDDWYYGFLKRHQQLSFKKPELLQKLRFDARNPETVYDFYSDLERLVNEYKLNTSEKAAFVFNCDESGFSTDPQRFKAIGEKGKPLCRISGGSGREAISVLATISADGSCLPPLIIFKGCAVQARWTSSEGYPGTQYTTSSNGWMEESQFFEWFNNKFIHNVLDLRQKMDMKEQTALLTFDGHSSHISYRIIKVAMDHNIQLLKFPSHLTDKIQPLDKCIFGPVKSKWNQNLIKHGKSQLEKHCNIRLTKCQFSKLLGDTWKEAMIPELIIKAFESTGIFPVNSKKFPENLFNPIDLKKYHDKKLGETSKFTSLAVENESQALNQPAPQAASTQLENETSTLQNETNLPSNYSTTPEIKMTNQPTPRKVIEIFSRTFKNQCPSTMQLQEGRCPRLKPSRYGEILTSSEVLKKLEAVEEKKLKKKSIKKKKCDTEDEKLLVDDNSLDDEDPAESILRETIDEIEYIQPSIELLTPGTFVLIDFVGGSRQKTHYKYVCRVIKIDDDDFEILVQGFKMCNNFATEFVLHENDKSFVEFEQIKAILPTPTIRIDGRKQIFVFSGKVEVFEKFSKRPNFDLL